MWPSVGASSPGIMFRVVVLPHPAGPSRISNPLSRTSSDRSSTAAEVPKRRVTCSSRTVAMVCSRSLTRLRLLLRVLRVELVPIRPQLLCRVDGLLGTLEQHVIADHVVHDGVPLLVPGGLQHVRGQRSLPP